MNLNAKISALETKLKQRDARILKLRTELRGARRYIHELTRPSVVDDDDEDMDVDEDEDEDEVWDGEEDDDDDDEEDEGEEEDDGELPEALIVDEVYACSSCGTEVLDGLCHGYWCGMKHQWPPKDGLDRDYSVSTNNLAIHPDRSLVRRGDTPLRDMDPNLNPPPPEEYEGRKAEYTQLLKRGATPLMCEIFHLEFTHKSGIYAWADSQIFDEFSGPLMKPGHFWKIHLGRRIELDKGDVDGSVFIEDLLEDAVMFPIRVEGCSKTHELWETKEESRGVWVTRLKAHKEDPDDEDRLDGSDSDTDSECWVERNIAEDTALEQVPSGPGGAIALNEYLPASDDEEDLDQSDHIFNHDEDEDNNGNDDKANHNDEDDDDDYDTPDSDISDSDDEAVCDPAFQLVSMFGPDQVWPGSADEGDANSDDENYDELGEQE